MGIEDFDVDLDSYTDSVLVLGTSEESNRAIGDLLERRSYSWQSATSIEQAKEKAATTLFDLLVVDAQSGEQDAHELVSTLRAESSLSRSPILLIHPDAGNLQRGQESVFGDRITVLPAPLEPSAFLVKVSMRLRLGKIKTEQAGFEAELASQNAQLRDLNNRFKAELKSARDLQQSLFPKTLPSAPKSSFAAACVPLEAVGGDLYDVWKIDRGVYGLFLGDVTGHGLTAAFIGAMTKMALAYAPQQSPNEMLANVNDGLCNRIPEGTFVTAAAAIFKPMEATVEVARAGHPPPYLWRAATGEVEQLEPRGLPLGVTEGMPYELQEYKLESGDKFLMITDGLTETVDMNGTMLGVDGVGKLFSEAAAAGKSISECIAEILETQTKFSGGRLLKDDNTLVGFEYNEGK